MSTPSEDIIQQRPSVTETGWSHSTAGLKVQAFGSYGIRDALALVIL
jgi:hypothetical protein